jgi:hypothetical protein
VLNAYAHFAYNRVLYISCAVNLGKTDGEAVRWNKPFVIQISYPIQYGKLRLQETDAYFTGNNN